MNRIERIKKHRVGHGNGYSDDIEYLLSKLEIAEKALEEANEKLGKITSKDFTNGQLRYEAATIIQEALQQIRE